MLYDLACTKCEAFYQISCTIKNKPTTCKKLIAGLNKGFITFQDPDKEWESYITHCTGGKLRLDVRDYMSDRGYRKLPVYINWPRVEDS